MPKENMRCLSTKGAGINAEVKVISSVLLKNVVVWKNGRGSADITLDLSKCPPESRDLMLREVLSKLGLQFVDFAKQV